MNAVYARQSVDKKDSLSIEGQIELCMKFAGEDARIFQDRGYSGKNIRRPAFSELIGAIENGEIQKIVVYRLDRFSRSIADFSRLWELLEKHGVAFQSVTEQFDTSSPIGRAMLNIVLVFAQLERETTAERVKDNYVHRFRLGAWGGGPAPFGFELTKVMLDGRPVSSLAANEKAALVKRIFSEYSVPEASLRSVANTLNSEGIHGPRREMWDSVTLSRILHSPVYVRADKDVFLYYLTNGVKTEQAPNDFDGVHACNVIGRRDRGKNRYSMPDSQMLTVSCHEGIIDSSLWLAVQDKLQDNRQLSRANAGKHSWLTGLIKCGRCGYAVKISKAKGKDNVKLVCSGRSNFSACDAEISTDISALEDYIASEINEILERSVPEQCVVQDAELPRRILDTERKIERLVNALAESENGAAFYITRQIERLHREREELFSKARHESGKKERLDFYSASFDEKKVIAAEFIELILLEDDKVDIRWKI